MLHPQSLLRHCELLQIREINEIGQIGGELCAISAKARVEPTGHYFADSLEVIKQQRCMVDVKECVFFRDARVTYIPRRRIDPRMIQRANSAKPLGKFVKITLVGVSPLI